jgi:hypothetical protein
MADSQFDNGRCHRRRAGKRSRGADFAATPLRKVSRVWSHQAAIGSNAYPIEFTFG